MTQFKDGEISWNIDNNNIRETIKLLFPIYYIDTRKLDIFTWEQLWQIISDLSATMPQISQEECRDLIDFTFTEIYGNKYTLSKEKIEVAFKKNNISLDPYHFDSKYKNGNAFSPSYNLPSNSYFTTKTTGLGSYTLTKVSTPPTGSSDTPILSSRFNPTKKYPLDLNFYWGAPT